MSTRPLSSGDIVADRRAEYAAMLAESGDMAAAAELIDQALELVPHWVAGWFLSGTYHEKAGTTEAAIAAYRKALDLDAADLHGAALRLALIEDRAAPDLPPSAYVKGLFDDYAERFDDALVNKLQYRVPGLLAALIDRSVDRAGILGAGGVVVDLGCGTGLMGEALGPLPVALEGWDLSPNMLRQARTRGLYRHLGQADLSLPPDRSGFFDGFARGRAQLILAADVLMYLGDLQAALANAAALAKSGSLFALSVETFEDPERFALRPSMRYAHGAQFLAHALARHGFSIRAREEAIIRMDAGEPITGLLVLAEKTG